MVFYYKIRSLHQRPPGALAAPGFTFVIGGGNLSVGADSNGNVAQKITKSAHNQGENLHVCIRRAIGNISPPTTTAESPLTEARTSRAKPDCFPLNYTVWLKSARIISEFE